MLALKATPDGADAVELGDAPEPSAAADEAIVEVEAVSLNRGEVVGLVDRSPGYVAGWDLAGTVIVPAADGTGPQTGVRVVGLVRNGAWAQRAAVATRRMAELPDKVDAGAASTLPVAGMTALRALAHGGELTGARVLVTGAAGGVGRFAIQIAAQAGAEVTAVSANPARAAGLQAIGATTVLGDAANAEGRFDVILESVGGPSLAAALRHVATDGVVVSFGDSSRGPVTLRAGEFFGPAAGARLYALRLWHDLDLVGTGVGDLESLVSRLALGELDPQIALDIPWHEAARAMRALVGREVGGKAVLRVE